MSEGFVAAAIAGELVDHLWHLRRFQIDLLLPGIAEVVALKLAARQDRRQFLRLCGWRGMVCGNVIRGVGPLGVTCNGGQSQGQPEKNSIHAGSYKHDTTSTNLDALDTRLAQVGQSTSRQNRKM